MARTEQKLIEIKINIADAIQRVSDLNKLIKNLTDSITNLDKSTKQNSVSLKNMTLEIKNAAKEKQQIQKEIANEISAYDRLKQRYDEASKKARDLAASQGMNTVATKQAINETNKLGAQLNNINKSMAQGKTDIQAMSAAFTVLPGAIGRVSFAFQRLGVVLNTLLINPIFKTIAIIGGLITSFVLVAKQSMEFSFQMSKVKAITSATGEEFDTLRQKAIDIGATTLKTAVEVAKLQVELGKLGFAAKDINEMTYAITQLSVATDEDLAQSAEVVGAMIRAFGLEAKDTQKIVDAMSLSFMTSSLTLNRFGLAMTYVGPIARQAGLSFEETAAILAVLSNNMVIGSKSGTAIRRIFVELGEYAGGVTEKIQSLAESNFGLEEAKDEVGKYAMTALTALVQNAEMLRKYTEALENAAGSTEKMAKIMADNLTGDIILAKSAWESLWLSVENGEGIIGRVSRFFVQIWIGFLNDLNFLGKQYEKYLTWLSKEWIHFGKEVEAVFITVAETIKFVALIIEDFLDDGKFNNTAENAKKMGDAIKKAWSPSNWQDIIKLKKETKELEGNIRNLNRAVSPDEQRALNDRANAVRKFLSSERDILKADYEENLSELNEYYKKGTIDTDEYNKGKLILLKKYNEDVAKLNKTAAVKTLPTFDYESKIMEERAKAMEVGREKELAAIDADYNAKLVKSRQHIDKLKQQEKAGVKGAKEARIQAEKEQEEYELALEEGKARKKIEINLKYDKLQADNALAELKHQHDMMIAQNELSAKEQYDLTVKYAENEYIAKKAQLDLMNISEEEYINKSNELWNQRQLAIANGEKKLTNDLHSENLARLNNELAALTTGKDAQFQDIDAVFNKKTETLNAQKAKELEAAGTNAELIKSIEAKYAAESIALEQWKTTSKVEKYKFWADTALNVGSEINKAITAFAEHELSVWAKANEGKANFDVEYEKKKIELQRKEAIREKALAVMTTTINTAAAIVGFLAKPSGLVGAALSVAAGITGAAQIAAILATPLPSMSSSGSGKSPKVERRTVTEKFHSGGTIGTTTGEEKPITALTGESVNTIATTQMFSPILSALNQIGGGKAITSGVNTSMGTDMLAASFSKALRQMPAPRIIWSDFETASERQRMIENNRLVR